jgi:hypothetical protein
MKKALTLVLIFLLSSSIISAQDGSKKNIETIKTIRNNLWKVLTINKHEEEIKTFSEYLDFIENIETERSKLNGSVSFGLNGNESKNSNLYNINTGIEVNYGGYPLEINAKTELQTQISNGNFEENFSTLDISMDYHPFNSTVYETYAFVKRSKIKFLGIKQRYEIGGGIMFNFYSSNKNTKKSTTEKGVNLYKKLEKFENKKIEDLEIKKCIDSVICKKEKLISPKAAKSLTEVKNDYEKLFKKKYSKHRVAILLGINYEIENTDDNLVLYNSKNDSITSQTFDATNMFRFVIAPKYEWKGDAFKWKNTLFFKTSLNNSKDNEYSIDIIQNNNTITLKDKKSDYFIEFISSFEFNFNKKLSFEASYNYIYDNAPKRNFYQNDQDQYLIAKSDHYFTALKFSLKYSL